MYDPPFYSFYEIPGRRALPSPGYQLFGFFGVFKPFPYGAEQRLNFAGSEFGKAVIAHQPRSSGHELLSGGAQLLQAPEKALGDHIPAGEKL